MPLPRSTPHSTLSPIKNRHSHLQIRAFCATHTSRQTNGGEEGAHYESHKPVQTKGRGIDTHNPSTHSICTLLPAVRPGAGLG